MAHRKRQGGIGVLLALATIAQHVIDIMNPVIPVAKWVVSKLKKGSLTTVFLERVGLGLPQTNQTEPVSHLVLVRVFSHHVKGSVPRRVRLSLYFLFLFEAVRQLLVGVLIEGDAAGGSTLGNVRQVLTLGGETITLSISGARLCSK